MRKLFCLLFFLALCSIAFSQDQPKPQTPPTIGKVMANQLHGLEGQFVSAAEAMPEDKFSFVPPSGEFKGARTYAQQIKHVAAVNYMVAAPLLGEKSPVDPGKDENGPDNIVTKEQIIKFLKDSFAYATKAEESLNEKNVTQLIQSPFGTNKVAPLSLGTLLVSHGFDHYGQMVIYLRMNGIVPPASRGR